MTWGGYFEDNWDRLQASITDAEQALRDEARSAQERSHLAQKALLDARCIIRELYELLDVATQPDMELARKVNELRIMNAVQAADLLAAAKDNDILRSRIRELELLPNVAAGERSEMEKKIAKLQAKITHMESPQYWMEQIKRYL